MSDEERDCETADLLRQLRDRTLYNGVSCDYTNGQWYVSYIAEGPRIGSPVERQHDGYPLRRVLREMLDGQGTESATESMRPCASARCETDAP